VIDAQRRALCKTPVFHYSFVINLVASMRERSLIAITYPGGDLPIQAPSKRNAIDRADSILRRLAPSADADSPGGDR
jgi:hypothetical protein